MSDVEPTSGMDDVGQFHAVASDAAVPPYSRKRLAGGEPNAQISLRIPASWIFRLRERAIHAAGHEERTITAQEIVRRIIADALSRPF